LGFDSGEQPKGTPRTAQARANDTPTGIALVPERSF